MIRKTFAPYGKIDEVYIARDAVHHKPKGFGWVRFLWPISATIAMQDKDNIEVLGCKVKIGTAYDK